MYEEEFSSPFGRLRIGVCRSHAGRPAAHSTAYTTDPGRSQAPTGQRSGFLGLAFFAVVDANVDNSVSRSELKATLEKFLADADTDEGGDAPTADQLQAGVKFHAAEVCRRTAT